MASANKKFTPLKKCASNLHEPQHIAMVLLGDGLLTFNNNSVSKLKAFVMC